MANGWRTNGKEKNDGSDTQNSKNDKNRLVGISSKEARQLLEQNGPNEIEPADKKTPLRIFISQFQNPLIYILIAAAIIAFFLGEQTDATIIIAIMLVNAALGFAQEYRSEKALEELRKYVSLTARAIRDGQTIELNAKELVVGDLIMVSIGDIVPADAKLVDAQELEANESVLTGESNPILKSNGDPISMGTVITAGSGKAIVAAVGKQTYLGKSAHAMKAPEPQTDFERSIRAFGSMLVKVILIMSAFVFVINAALGHGILSSVLFALAIAVGITPELLPIIITIGLSSGAMRLVKKHVAVKRLEAIEDLGNIDVLCADKTGTLTENEVSLIRYVDCLGKENEKVLLYSLLCNSAILQDGRINGNTIDTAIWRYVKGQKDRQDPASPQAAQYLKDYRQVEMIAFDYERKRMSVVVEELGKRPEQGVSSVAPATPQVRTRILITKGAPEAVLPVCKKASLSGRETPISAHLKDDLEKMAKDFGREGYRVISVAYKMIDGTQGKSNGPIDYTQKDEKDLVFMGFLILLDPPKKDAHLALEHFRNLGVEVYVLTGDGPFVTAEICRRVGIEQNGSLVTGAELDALDPQTFAETIATHNVYARLTPTNKLAIVNSLRANGRIVGFIGDGVNDAPSLRAADVGISVRNGADIAKDAADVVLLRKGLDVVAAGISEGRKTFGNIIKYIHNTISANFGNMFTLTAASLFLPFIPLLPAQILLNNLLSDIPMLAVSTDNVDKENLRRPKRWDINQITRFMVFFGLISSVFDIATMAFVLLVLGADMAVFRTVWFLESVLSEILVMFAIRTSRPIYKSMPSKLLAGLTALVVLISVGVIYSPLAPYFEFAALSPQIIGVVFGIVLVYVMIVELAKRIFYSRQT